MVKSLEKRIIGKMSAIKRGEISKKDSKVGLLFNQIKTLDESLYISLVVKYKDLIVE